MTGDSGEAVPKTEPPQIFVERTLAIIKPDAIHKSDEIEDIILRSGFTILQVNKGVDGGPQSHLTPKFFTNPT